MKFKKIYSQNMIIENEPNSYYITFCNVLNEREFTQLNWKMIDSEFFSTFWREWVTGSRNADAGGIVASHPRRHCNVLSEREFTNTQAAVQLCEFPLT